ncbi:MAG: SCP-like extracellular [Actinotalea sp.]|nr:SCP-like extracellular [Actinotalea sp.]
MLSLAGCTTAPSDETAPISADPGATALGLVDGTNTARADEDLPALTTSACATEAALTRATALSGTADLTHAPLDDVLSACDVSTAAENLSRAPAGTSPQDVVTAWMESPGHRSNILDPGLTRVGVACIEDGGSLLCAQIFLGP